MSFGVSPTSLWPNFEDWLPLLKQRKDGGSSVAKGFFIARDKMEEAVRLFKCNRIPEAFRSLVETQRYWAWEVTSATDKLNKDVEEIVIEAKKRYEVNPFDMDSMFVSLSFETQGTPHWNRVHRDLKSRYHVLHDCKIGELHFFAAARFLIEQDPQAAIEAIDRAIKCEPYRPNWLYERALNLCNFQSEKGQDIWDSVDAFQQFLNENPPDHPNVPNALYWISTLLHLNGQKDRSREFWIKARAAEDPNVRLPCFPPVDSNDCWKGKLNRLYSDPCGNCSKYGATSRCSKCKRVSYCGKKCQRMHWKKHKKSCA